MSPDFYSPIISSTSALHKIGGMRLSTHLARVTGLEPATSGVTGRRSNQLSYTRMVGRGHRLRRWPGIVNPIGTGSLVGGDGFEPPTLSV